ncbi:MAG: AMP-binding protein, partial [Candidatus Limnocylindria bacterium]
MPEKTAVILGDRALTFAALDKRANRVAHTFAGLGCVAEDRVAVMSFNSMETFEVASGLRRSGVVIVPVNYRLRGAEVAYVLNDSGAKVVLAGPDHVEVVEGARTEVTGDPRFVAVGDAAPPGWLSYRDLIERSTDAPVPDAGGGGLGPSMIYTSGTTGHPKGAWRPHGVNLENVLQIISIFELNQSDVHLTCGPGYHSAVSFFTALH